MTLYVTSSYAAPRIVLVSQRAEARKFDARTVARQQLRAELAADGFEVVMTADAAGPPEELEESARRTRSLAAVRLLRTDEGLAADVWIQNPSTGETLVQRVKEPGNDAQAARTLAMRAAELLGATLLVLSVAPREPSPAQRSLSAWLGAAAVGHPGGISTGVGPALGIGWQAAPSLGLELRVILPVLGDERAVTGTAETDQEIALACVRFEPETTDALFGLAAVGVGGYRFAARGRAAGPVVGRTDAAIAAAFSLGAGLGIRAVKTSSFDLAVVLRGDALFLMPRPVLALGEASPRKTGQPLLAASGGVEVTW